MDENSVSCSLLLYLKYSWLMSVSVMCLDDTPNPGILSDTPNFHIVTWPHTTFHLPRWLRFATFDDSTQHNTLKFMDIHWYSLYALSPDSIPGADLLGRPTVETRLRRSPVIANLRLTSAHLKETKNKTAEVCIECIDTFEFSCPFCSWKWENGWMMNEV